LTEMHSEKKNTVDTSFREAMADVKPLRTPDRIEPIPRKTPAIAAQREKDDREVLRELLEFKDDSAELETGEELLYLRPGHQQRTLKRLRRGYFSVSDTIDLHHMSAETAKKVLLDFIDQALRRHMGCVRVVHGKGLRSRHLPKLKIMTNRTLRKHPSVIAFASCRPVAGGTGATNILLSVRLGPRR
jgi:DNA-nicking Smr family endonuclease